MTIRWHSECMLATACASTVLSPAPHIRPDDKVGHHDSLHLIPALGPVTVPFQDRFIRLGLDPPPLEESDPRGHEPDADLAASDQGHLGGHDGEERYAGVQGKVRHVEDGTHDMLHVDGRLDGDTAIGLLHAFLHFPGHGRGGVANVDLTACNVILTSVQSRRLGQPGNGVLGGGVGGGVGAWCLCGYRAIVDDATSAWILLLHDAEGLARAQERPGEVGIHHLLPCIQTEVLQQDRGRTDAGVVEKEVKPTQDLAGGREQMGDRFRVCNIAWHHEHGGLPVTNGTSGFLESLTAAARRHDRVACPGQAQRGGTANAGTSPGHQGCLDRSRHIQGIYQQNTVASIRIRRET